MSDAALSNSSMPAALDYSSFQHLHTIEGCEIRNNSMQRYPYAIAPDTQHLITCGLRGALSIWSLETGLLRSFPSTPNTDMHAKAIAVSLNGARCYVVYTDRYHQNWQIQIQDIANGQTIETLQIQLKDILHIAISPNERLLALNTWREGIEVWDLQEKRSHRFQSKSRYPVFLQFTPDGHKLISEHEGAIIVWHSYTGTLIQKLTYPQNSGACRTIGISPDSQTIVGVDGKGRIQQWHLNSAASIFSRVLPRDNNPKVRGHNPYGLASAAFSPDGQTLFETYRNGDIKLWNWYTGELLCSLRADGYGAIGYENYVIDKATFSPDSHRIVTSGEDGRIQIWGSSTRLSHQPGPKFRHEPDVNNRRSQRQQWLRSETFRGAFEID